MSDVTFPPYLKINGLYKRDDRGRFTGDFSRPEFEYLYYNEWLCTEKVDGTNIRIGTVVESGTVDVLEGVRIGGRTDNAQIPVTLLEVLQPIADRLTQAEDIWRDEDGSVCNVTLYGEGYGKKIQKGGGNYHADRCDFVLFDVKVADWWLKRSDVVDVATQLGLDVVPEVATCTLEEAERLCRTGFDSSWGPFPAEGVVCTPVVPLFARDRKRVITKLKTKDYAEAKADAKVIPFPVISSNGDCVGYPPLVASAA